MSISSPFGSSPATPPSVLGLRPDPLTSNLMQMQPGGSGAVADDTGAITPQAFTLPLSPPQPQHFQAPPKTYVPPQPPIAPQTAVTAQSTTTADDDDDAPTQTGATAPQTSPPAATGSFWSGSLPTLGDVLDIVNPLQHIPIVSSIYRAVTGDTQSQGASIAGGALYGGPLGLIASFFDSAIKDTTGQDTGQHVIAALTGSSTDSQTAQNSDGGTAQPSVAAQTQGTTHYTLAQLRTVHLPEMTDMMV